MADDFGSGAYLARTGQLGYSQPGAKIGAGGNDPISNYFPEGSPMLAVLIPVFGKTSGYGFSTVKHDPAKGVDVLLEPAKVPGFFGSPWANSKFAQSLKTMQDARKSTASTEQIIGTPPHGAPRAHNFGEDEGMSR